MSSDSIGEQLAAWGRVALIESVGRTTSKVARTAVGFVEEPDGSLLVAAGSETADWALNLLAHPRCTVSVGDVTSDYLAEPIEAPAAAAAINALILKYGTPAERLGRGPAFRLRPTTTQSQRA